MNGQQPAGGRSWVRRHAELATIAGAVFAALALVVAIFAWRWPVGSQPAGGTSTSSTITAASQTGGGSTSAAGATRYLTDMSPSAGRSNIEPNQPERTFVLKCGAGGTVDPYREVRYTLRGVYREFLSDVVVAQVEAPEVGTQLEVFADGVQVANAVLEGEQSAPVTAKVAGAEELALRLTCGRDNTVVSLRDARVIR